MASQEQKTENTELSEEEILKNTWAIRPCQLYKEEYNDCTSIKARFHQYFIHGESIDCSQWKLDFDNCIKYEDSKDLKAANNIIESEKMRRQTRLKAHYNNDTWKKRKSPPEDWSKPLPEWLQKEYENSYLMHKSKEMSGEIITDEKDNRTLCVIM